MASVRYRRLAGQSVCLYGYGALGRDAVSSVDALWTENGPAGKLTGGVPVVSTHSPQIDTAFHILDPEELRSIPPNTISETSSTSILHCGIVPVPREPGHRTVDVDEIMRVVDTMVIVSGSDDHSMIQSIQRLFALLFAGGTVNLDLGDFRTICDGGTVAAFRSTALPANPTDISAVTSTLLEDVCGRIDIGSASGAVLGFSDGNVLTLEDISRACGTVRASIPDSTLLLWGIGDHPTGGACVDISLLVAGNRLTNRTKSTRDAEEPDCPRCDSTLVRYVLGNRATRACENCGFADIGLIRD